MKKRNFFSRIACDTAKLEELITRWTQNEGWEFEIFADFLELAGVKTPVKLSELDENNSFKCVTALDTEIRISLFFGDWIDFCSELHIAEGEETRCYITNSKSDSKPKVTLQRRNVKRDGKELESYYCSYFCSRTLKLDATHVLKIEISEPNKLEEKSEIFVLRNLEDIEEYLLGLDNSLVVAEVYKKMVEFLDFSSADILKCEKFLISYVIKDDVREKIFLTNGKMKEYAIIENKETFHVFDDGSWRYLSDSGISIVFHESRNQYVFSVTGTEDNIITQDLPQIMKHVKTQISKLWEFVK